MARTRRPGISRLSPVQSTAKRIIDKVINNTTKKSSKKKVQFCKIVHKKNITPRAEKGAAQGYFYGGDPALSFTELTDQSAQSITASPENSISVTPIIEKFAGISFERSDPNQGNTTPPRKVESPLSSTALKEKRERRRSNLYVNMSGSIKTFFNPKPGKRSVPSRTSAKEEEDAEILFVDEVINTKKKSISTSKARTDSTTSAAATLKPRNSKAVTASSSKARTGSTSSANAQTAAVSSSSHSMPADSAPARPTPKLWVDAFIPTSEADIIHGPSLDSLKEWLKRWHKKLTILAKAENEPPNKKRKKSSSRKHAKEDESDSDYEVENETEELCTTFVLSGPTGCGKTSFVHLLAKEHGFNVIELSASDDRSSLTMARKLQGAMENFGVRGPGDIRTALFGGGGAAQKSKTSALKYNLVLIDDADVVFKSDAGFWSKLGTFSIETKIPIVLTCTNRSIVVCHMENSEFEKEHFIKREKTIISRHLNEWITEHSGIIFDKNILRTTVKESNQDIRKALNNLQFNGNRLSIEQEKHELMLSKEHKISSDSLAELDCILTKCNEFERRTKIRWNAKLLSNIDYIPGRSPLHTYDIPAVDNNNEYFIKDLSLLMSTNLPEEYRTYEKWEERLSTNLLSRHECYAPILPAVYDAYKRSDPASLPRIIALYELPVLAAIHRGFNDRMNGKKASRRVLHPFNHVDLNVGRALDCHGTLNQTIDEYSNWLVVDEDKVDS